MIILNQTEKNKTKIILWKIYLKMINNNKRILLVKDNCNNNNISKEIVIENHKDHNKLKLI